MLRTYNRKLKKHIGHRIYPIREFNFVFSKRLKNRDISFKSEKREQRSMSILSTKREREREKKTGQRFFFLKCKRGYFNLERSRYDIGFLVFIFIGKFFIFFYFVFIFFFLRFIYTESKFLFKNL